MLKKIRGRTEKDPDAIKHKNENSPRRRDEVKMTTNPSRNSFLKLDDFLLVV